MIIESYCNSDNILNDLVFYFQPIVETNCQHDPQHILYYELLLRSKTTQSFPVSAFAHLISNEKGNAQLMGWIHEQITQLTHDYPQTTFGLNLEPQQLRFPTTFQGLTELAPFHHQLILELTESPILCQNLDDFVETILPLRLKALTDLGFKIIIDDIESGANNLQLVMHVLPFIMGLKWTPLHFSKLNHRVTLEFLKVWCQLANDYHLIFIAEAVEDQEISNYLDSQNVHFQQGYYWQRPQPMLLIDFDLTHYFKKPILKG